MDRSKTARRRGQTLVALALMLGAALLFLGLLLDGGRLYFESRLAQSAADSAAVGGAAELKRGNTGLVTDAARADALLQGYDDAASDVDVDVNMPPLAGPRAGDSSFVEVVVTRRFPNTFMQLVSPGSSTVRARAVAGLRPDAGPPCILALNPTASSALLASGSSTVTATDCNVMVNSNSTAAIRTNGGACIVAQQIGFVQPGSYLGNGQACVVPAPQGRAIPSPDPFAYLAEPDPDDYVKRSNSKLQITKGNASSNSPLEPGYYKGGIKITGGSIAFNPGLYLIEGLEVSGNADLYGTDVTFFNNGQGLKGISIAGTVFTQLSAPKSGDWQNILFFNSRSVPKNNQTEVKITGTSDSYFEGVQYFPSVHVDYAGNALSGPTWTMLIGDTLRFTGSSRFEVSFGGAGGRTPTTTRVALVE